MEAPREADAPRGAGAVCEDFIGRVQAQLLLGRRVHLPGADAGVPSDAEVELRVTREVAASASRRRGTCSLGLCSLTALWNGSPGSDLGLRQGLSYIWRTQDFEGEDSREEEGDASVSLDCRPSHLTLRLPRSLVACPELAAVLGAWCSTATRSLASAVEADPRLGLLTASAAVVAGPVVEALRAALSSPVAGLVSPGSVPLVMGSVVPSGFLTTGLTNHVGLYSLTSAIMFIMSIRGLNKHSTSERGNYIGMLATVLGIASVLVSQGLVGPHFPRFLLAFLAASGVGYGVASQVSMEEMPQLVAGFHSFVGLAAVFAGCAGYFNPSQGYHFATALETILGTGIGMLTFSGSVVAAGKLHGVIPGRPIVLENRWKLNFAGLAGSAVLSSLFCSAGIYGSGAGLACLLANSAIWAGLGANMVLPIGGADMPVVVSLLNAFSGLATSTMGFMLSNNLLTITGALVASSGALLSDIMCRGINRSIGSVLLGGFGVEDGAAQVAGLPQAAAGPVREVSANSFVGMLLTAKRVVIVPGYGLAVARCQQRLAEIVALLRSHGVVVHFAIHPVAGRLPGHMNVLLAEADVPYDIVREMEDVHRDLPSYDVAVVIGANDIVNPATQDDTTSPIYGMPAIEVWRCKSCIVLKRSLATGYSGVDNPLFYRDSVRMLFGDAKHSLDVVHHLLEESQDSILGAGSPGAEYARSSQPVEDYPVASKVVGVIRERRPGERRVSIGPSAVPAFRRMGFAILLEAGAGLSAGFADEEYVRQGEVRVAESASEVLLQADVVLKVNEPLLDEVQMLKSSQTMVGFWNMFETEELMAALGQTQASIVNLALVPRVSRAQKLDALTSMANIAGYRAVLDAFNKLPRFSRSAVTAGGAVPPARVFVIGVGVAGLSAIATAHALGAKVCANDVRAAARDQVGSLGAEFVPVDAEGISGEGAGGYASEVGDAFKAAQLATYARIVPEMDVVITTAMIPNRAAPTLITEDMVRSMRRGSVIVDLAAATGGNCPLSQADRVVETPGGVTIIGETNYPAAMAAQASDMIGSNFAALLETLGGAADFGGAHWDDPIVRPATIAHQGQLLPPLPTAPAAPPPAAAQVPVPVPGPAVPEGVDMVLAWLHAHRDELALGLGAATILGLGLGVEIPEQELTHMGYFVLSMLIGHFTVASVTPALHTPLISVTNAISGIIVVGGMLQLSGPLLSARVACALAAVFLSSVNIVGGFAVTHRMLGLFREDKRRIEG